MTKVELKDGKAVITIDFDKKGIPSKSGKSMVHATTSGNQSVRIGDSEYKLGINLYSTAK